jgi:hypothetical protein
MQDKRAPRSAIGAACCVNSESLRRCSPTTWAAVAAAEVSAASLRAAKTADHARVLAHADNSPEAAAELPFAVTLTGIHRILTVMCVVIVM